MKADQAHQMVTQAAERLGESLAAGKSDSLKEFLRTMARFHSYSVGNAILIGLQKPDATRVAGYNTWKSLGRQVRRGAKGISIVAPVVARVPKAARDELNLATEDREVEETIVSFRGATVFDIADTDGRPLPDVLRANGDPGVYLERLLAYIAKQGIAIAYAKSLAGAEGISCGGKIIVRKNLPPAEMFSVLLHELSHEMLHHGDDVPESKTVRETEAEATAYVVCEAVGIDSRLASADYVLLYDGSVETLRLSLHRIRRTAHTIIDAILRDGAVHTGTVKEVEVEQIAEAA